MATALEFAHVGVFEPIEPRLLLLLAKGLRGNAMVALEGVREDIWVRATDLLANGLDGHVGLQQEKRRFAHAQQGDVSHRACIGFRLADVGKWSLRHVDENGEVFRSPVSGQVGLDAFP